ncbi:MAG: bifunctional folylpolyglutamate synthase/dihydrofolate synthase [Butyrivibrio sp.]|nr:bifunctional folylpolyglutamate synthase/dihydrofolate synthase [Butyrivibrio sp.]
MQKYNYEEAISFFGKLPHFEPPKDSHSPKKDFFSLDAELALLEKLNNPQNDLKYIHVAGTNGKGSTIAYITSVLIESGLKVGTFTSPFLYRYNELFKVNNTDISDKEFGRLFSKVKPAYDELAAKNIFPSEYEILTVMSFIYFKEMGCDIVVLEVSMGGRTDTTNVIPSPLVTVITPISYDHMSILGNTLTEIATEKAGIIKKGTVVVSAPQEPETQRVIERTCTEKNVSLEYTKIPSLIERSLQGQSFKLDRIYKTKLLGSYQIENASTALLVIDKLKEKAFSFSDEAIERGISKTEWFGRFTVVRENPYVIVDGGHNRQGAAVLRRSLEEYFPGKKITFLLGILADKEVDIILDELMPIAKKCYVAAVPNKRTMDPQILAKMIRTRGVEATVLVEDIALENIIKENEITCIEGSLYLIKKIINPG